MTDEELKELKLLKGLYKEHGEKLVDEITYIVSGNGQGDCYQCLCWDYCNSQRSCFDAIKLVVLDYLKGGKDNAI